MPKINRVDKSNEIGTLATQLYTNPKGIVLKSAQCLPSYQLAYETYGLLNSKKNNAILLCHALTASQHAAGIDEKNKEQGWWDSFIGPNKPLDTNFFFVVCINNIGSCYGSTGPQSINPVSHKVYGKDFPIVTVDDWVLSQYDFMRHLGIKKWLMVVGGSLGGMQVTQWSIRFPNCLEHALIIASAAKLSAQNIAFNEIARQTITMDKNYQNGHYYHNNTPPNQGLSIARMLGHVTYLSDEGMGIQFGRDLKSKDVQYRAMDADFQIESYLRYQGQKFIEKIKFDANSYILMTKALDYFDLAKNHNDCLSKAFQTARCSFLIISFSSDWRFSPKRSEEIVHALIQNNLKVNYFELKSNKGHDSFLLPLPDYYSILKDHMEGLKHAL